MCNVQGYAFVQFTSPFDARSACLGEDGKTLCGQVLDVNMVSEPKAHLTKTKATKRAKEKSEGEAGQGAGAPLLACGGARTGGQRNLHDCGFGGEGACRGNGKSWIAVVAVSKR